jgi:hypothetical protein
MRSPTLFYEIQIVEDPTVATENLRKIEHKLLRQSLLCEQKAVTLLFESALKNQLSLEEMLLLTATRALQLKLILEHYQKIVHLNHENFDVAVNVIAETFPTLRAEAEMENSQEIKFQNACKLFATLLQKIKASLFIVSNFIESHSEISCENELIQRYLGNIRNCTHFLMDFTFRNAPRENLYGPFCLK